VDMAFYTACEGLGLDAYPYAVRDPKEMQSYDSYSSDNDGSDSDFSDEESASDAPPTTSKEGYYDHRRLLHIESGSSASDEVVLKYLQDGVDWKTKRNGTAFSWNCLADCLSLLICASYMLPRQTQARQAGKNYFECG
jgi:hypothetical protein